MILDLSRWERMRTVAIGAATLAVIVLLAVLVGPLTWEELFPGSGRSGLLERTVAPDTPRRRLEARVAAARRSGAYTPTVLGEVLDALDYRLEAVAAGGPVPWVEVTSLPPGLGRLRDIPKRKDLFFRAVLPLVLMENDRIRADRVRLERIKWRLDRGRPLTKSSLRWLEALADRYDANPGDLDELLRKVDEIPPSLALAQAAEESGWGTSRFARQGNALFGQWTWDADEGLAPTERAEGASHRVRAFDALGDAVAAYMRNLNRHPAYKPMRRLRARMRAEDKPLSGRRLAAGLVRYSQRGHDYVQTLRAIIAANDLAALDDTKLSRYRAVVRF